MSDKPTPTKPTHEDQKADQRSAVSMVRKLFMGCSADRVEALPEPNTPTKDSEKK
jgi:hypothetical protein